MKKLLTIVITILLLLTATITFSLSSKDIQPVEEKKEIVVEENQEKEIVPEKKPIIEEQVITPKKEESKPKEQNVIVEETKEIDGETLVYIGTYHITGYDICVQCCGKSDGITASGTYATPGRTIAMKGYPYGTKVYIEGLGYRIIEDTGGFSSNTIDVVCNNHSECYAITGNKKVYLVQ